MEFRVKLFSRTLLTLIMSSKKTKHPHAASSNKAVTDAEREGGEIQVQKSPAEFFAEHQAIAGFDNLGKSLYTTIRELMENGLDACEAVHRLPDISVSIQEYNQSDFNRLTTEDLRLSASSVNGRISDAGSSTKDQHVPMDTKLFEKKKGTRKSSVKKETDDTNEDMMEPKANAKASQKAEPSSKQTQYFLITVTDNGCGMEHAAIPEMLGRVLSGSKYGVRQTRGKFGLGAKMALIWSKKSTGHPIHVLTAHQPQRASDDASIETPPPYVSSCILDIDIYRNEPRVVEHTRMKNTTGFMGTTVRVLIAGNWTTYRSRVLQYLQQLAIITPYAALSLTYLSSDDGDRRRHVELLYQRRSEQMPDTPGAVKHHPASVNNIIIQQLVQYSKTKTLLAFLTKELQAISVALAKRLIAELATSVVGFTEDMPPSDLTNTQITRLVQLFHQVQLFRPPDGTCLSPLGEYNLNLGIHKVLEPDFVATFRDKVSVYEGHAFVIEAAVSMGGTNAKEGITVYRFANRIPLLFEGGADVVTRVATTKIKWSNYKVDYKKDKVGVFVSIVSTKIPFKGTSKEYIGDDGMFYNMSFLCFLKHKLTTLRAVDNRSSPATEIHQSVKRSMQSCCQQLRSHLMKRNALKDAKTRRSKLVKYIPDVSRSLYGLLDGMRQRKMENDLESQSTSIATKSPSKRLRLDPIAASKMILMLNKNQITEETIGASLMETIETGDTLTDAVNEQDTESGKKTPGVALALAPPVPVYIVPLYNFDDSRHDVRHPLFTFRPILPLPIVADD
jgi:DNA topoisomerase VI subunit B